MSLRRGHWQWPYNPCRSYPEMEGRLYILLIHSIDSKLDVCEGEHLRLLSPPPEAELMAQDLDTVLGVVPKVRVVSHRDRARGFSGPCGSQEVGRWE